MEYNKEQEEKLEEHLDFCQKEISRLQKRCRQYEERLNKPPIRQLLELFDEHRWKGGYSIGRWSIANGGYDLWFEIYKDNIPQISCIDGQVSACRGQDSETEEIIKELLEVFGHLQKVETDQEDEL